ncbi:MAG: hypothetical protein CMP21_08950 [Rickettsiales bacterium]|nr:hypothetical protein [Rickettsiales bacterium]
MRSLPSSLFSCKSRSPSISPPTSPPTSPATSPPTSPISSLPSTLQLPLPLDSASELDLVPNTTLNLNSSLVPVLHQSFNGLNFFRDLCFLENKNIKIFILPHSDEQGMDVDQELNNISLDVSLGKDSNNNISILPNTKKNIQSLKQSLDILIAEHAIDCFFVVEDMNTNIAFINKNINKFNKDSILAKTYADAQRELEKLKQQTDPLTVCVILDMNFP